jgi:hypothetical protein
MRRIAAHSFGSAVMTPMVTSSESAVIEDPAGDRFPAPAIHRREPDRRQQR